MSYFWLLPLFWLSGIALYASSPRQTLNQSKEIVISRKLAIAILLFTVVISFVFLHLQGMNLVINLLSLLLLCMLFVPAPVFLLSHKPKWAAPGLAAVVAVSAGLQLLTGAA